MKQPTLKLSVALISAIMLSACQSTPNNQYDSLAKANLAYSHTHGTAQELFSDNAQSAATINKNTLINALTKHLQSERYSLTTTQSKTMPAVAKDSINHGADPLLTSIIKTYEYQNQDRSPPAYRSYDEYFAEDELQLPLLRYDDELSGRIPAGVSTRGDTLYPTEGDLPIMGYDSPDRDMIYELHSSINSISLSLDNLVKDNPTITTRDAKVKELLKELDTIIKNFDTQSQTLSAKGGYIAESLAHAKSCAMIYNTTIRQALAPNRQIKSYADEQYDYYDLVYKNYSDCRTIDSLNLELSPSYYIALESSKEELDFVVQKKQCYLNQYHAIQSLLASGKGYHTDAQAFAQPYIDTINCIDAALHDRYNDYKLTQVNTLQDAMEQSYYQYYSPEPASEYGPFHRIKTAFDDFKRMKQDSQSQPSQTIGSHLPTDNLPPMFAGMLSVFLDNIKQTDGQIAAQNLYIHSNNVITTLSHHQPQSRQITTLGSLDFYSPTMEHSLQLPMQLDFNQSKLKADVSAILPFIAISMPKHAPLPSELPAQEMTFTLPNNLHQHLPMSVIYDAINQGVVDAIKELDGESFTAVDISNDKFAKKLGATSAIKVHYDMHGLGNVSGVIIKHIGQALKAHVDANPDDYADGKAANIKQAIDDLALINDGYHSQDLGNLMQLIESVFPMSLNHTHYFYLDRQGNIIGTQLVQSMNETLQNLRTESISQTQFSNKPFAHPLQDKFANSFSTNQEFDGTSWLMNAIEDGKLQKQAEEARQSYAYGQDDEYETAVEAAEAAAWAAVEAAAATGEFDE